MTLPTALEFTSPTDEVFTFYGWNSFASNSRIVTKSVSPMPGGAQDAWFYGMINESTIQFEILLDDGVIPTLHTQLPLYKCIIFEEAVRTSNQNSQDNWTMKIHYNSFAPTGSGMDGNPSEWVGKISAFTYTAQAPEARNKITGQVVFNHDNSS